jgi:hypothetical protein
MGRAVTVLLPYAFVSGRETTLPVPLEPVFIIQKDNTDSSYLI